jgi:hypothetical protein
VSSRFPIPLPFLKQKIQRRLLWLRFLATSLANRNTLLKLVQYLLQIVTDCLEWEFCCYFCSLLGWERPRVPSAERLWEWIGKLANPLGGR